MPVLYGASRQEWDAFASLNLQDLMPWVADPTVKVSPHSKLEPGFTKTPSVINSHGYAVGLPGWANPSRITEERDVIKWREEPRYGICMNGRKIKCLDIDVPDVARAQAIESFIRAHLGINGMLLPLRDREGTGKRALLYRMAEGRVAAYQRVNVRPTVETLDDGGVIEFLADTKQFVVAGMHQSGQRYRWPDGIPGSLNEIPALEEEEIIALYHALHKEFGHEGYYSDWKYNTPFIERERGQRATYKDDPAVQYMQDHDLILEYASDGGILVRCPWEHAHGSTTKQDAAKFYPAGANGRLAPGFNCFHGHTLLRAGDKPLNFVPTFVEFFDAIGYRAQEIDAEFPITVTSPKQMEPRPKFSYKGKSAIIEGSLSNVVAMLRWEGGGFRIRYDSFKDIIIYRRTDEAVWHPLNDDTYTEIRIAFVVLGMETPSHETVQRAVSFVAREQTVDTAIEWLKEQRWDGVQRLHDFHTRVLGLADTPYHRAAALYLWTALAGRIMEPGCKADMVPILSGAQGLRKSSLVEALAPSPDEYTVVTLADRDDNLARQLRGRMVVEWDELRGLSSRDAESLKGWVTRRKDDWIPKFKEFGTTNPRRFILIGTANPTRYLSDPTGLRRWLPLRVTRPIDVDFVIENRNQLWAEARVLWEEEKRRTARTTQTGVLWEEAERLAAPAQRDASIRDPWVDAVESWYAVAPGIGPWTTLEILNQACSVSVSQISYGTQERLRRVLTFLGWEETKNGRWGRPLA